MTDFARAAMLIPRFNPNSRARWALDELAFYLETEILFDHEVR